jgi:CDP-6-deoxy-D-xylo-4-hexulose-3-dehydrase
MASKERQGDIQVVELNIQTADKQALLEQLITDMAQSKKKTWTPGQDWVQYAGSYLDENEYIAVVRCLMEGWFALGENGIRFEYKFPTRLGKEHGCLTNSGSSANLLMVSALGSRKLHALPKGSKIITPVAGFPTTINPIIQNGYTPVFIDIEMDTLNLDIEQLEAAAKSGASALIFAHVLSNPPNMDAVMDIVKRYNLILLEDCCDALGSTYKGKPLGSFGEMASCSFYPAHHITLGEGGFVATKTKEQEMVVKSLREWGRGCYCSGKAAACLKNGMCKKRFSNWLPALPDEVFDHKYVYEEIGYNLKPLDLQAAMGLVQLEKLDTIIEKRKHNYRRLYSVFSKHRDKFVLPVATEGADPAWFAFPVTVKDNAGFKRTELTMFFEEHKIQTRNYFGGNILLQPGYVHLCNGDPLKMYPNATKATTNTFFLGTSPVILDEHIDYIETILDKFFESRKA